MNLKIVKSKNSLESFALCYLLNLDENDRRIFSGYIAFYNGDRTASIQHTVCYPNGQYTIHVVQEFEHPEFTRLMEYAEKNLGRKKNASPLIIIFRKT